MRSRNLIRICAVAAACAAVTALAGLQLADASSRATATRATSRHALCVKYDVDDTSPACFGLGRRGDAGPRGARGGRGVRGVQGTTGERGPIGPIGAVGPTGPQGAAGIRGIQGIPGNPGAFATGGADPGGQLVTITGTQVTFRAGTTNTGFTGTELQPPVVARCPVGGQTPEAYDGGVTVKLSGANASNDVVSLESSYPGLYVSSTEVDPLPIGAAPGAVSPEPANAYEGQAVITVLNANDSVTEQAYVLCGP